MYNASPNDIQKTIQEAQKIFFIKAKMLPNEVSFLLSYSSLLLSIKREMNRRTLTPQEEFEVFELANRDLENLCIKEAESLFNQKVHILLELKANACRSASEFLDLAVSIYSELCPSVSRGYFDVATGINQSRKGSKNHFLTDSISEMQQLLEWFYECKLETLAQCLTYELLRQKNRCFIGYNPERLNIKFQPEEISTLITHYRDTRKETFGKWASYLEILSSLS
ncbi:hypothetical protein [Vibrio sp. SCSIO 43155]|uniref:hypothetical protein n=1 Tax=Vibrio sp. SCSIO 43155 TaxID=2819099 RepID=UPI002075F826|nr:hypothetical protein [Vibrio sp. SCSIO 43155]USD58694.1 hypothetical protein J4N44_27460 [Vibrio sp. SCSIO 43155]